MGLQEARDILVYELTKLSDELSENYTYEKHQLYDALEFCVDKLNREIDSYCNLP
jgi:hypothetical protein